MAWCVVQMVWNCSGLLPKIQSFSKRSYENLYTRDWWLFVPFVCCTISITQFRNAFATFKVLFMRTTDRTGFDMSYWTNGYLFLSYMWLFHTGLTIFGTFFNRALGLKVGVFPGVTLPFRCQCLRKQLLHLNITCILDSCSSESDTLMMDLLDPSPPSNGKKMLLFVRFLCVCVHI